MSEAFFSVFPAFRLKNYQLYFAGMFISLVGTWIQQIAEGWLVLELTHSAFWVGAIAALTNLPVLFFSLFGGVIVDRFDIKKIIYVTQLLFFIFSLILGILTVYQSITIFSLAVLAFLLGLVNAIDMPARQAYTAEMVGKKNLASAVALNSALFNSARAIGPALAGITILLLGIGGAFILNAISYIAVIWALYYIATEPKVSHPQNHPIIAIKEAVSYAFTHASIKTLLVVTALISIFGWSFSTILPVIVKDIFQKDVSTYSLFSSCIGLGAIAGSITVSAFSLKIKPIIFLITGNIIFALSLLLFTYTTSLPVVLILLFLIGFGLLIESPIINTLIQHLSPDRLRGRIVSIYFLMFVGMMPLGSFQIGIVSDRFGPLVGIRIGVIIVLLCSVYLFLKRNHIKNIHESISVFSQKV